MKLFRTLAGAAALGSVVLLSGCVVAPLGPPGGYYGQPYGQPGPVYAESPAVVIAPPPVSFGFYGGYYRPHYGGYGPRRWR